MEHTKKHLWFWLALFTGLIFVSVLFVTIRLSRSSSASQDILKAQTQVEEIHISTPEQIIEPTVPDVKQVRMIAVGDMMLDRTVYLYTLGAKDFYFPFQKIGDFLQSADISVGNVEGPITNFVSVANGEGSQRLVFTFSPKFVGPLETYFDVVSLANNHMLNFGEKGLAQAREFLASSTLGYFGDPLNRLGNISTIVEKNGIRFAFIGFHELVETGFDNVLSEIEDLEDQVDLTIVYPHWGYEYVTTNPSNPQRTEAHALIDAGADLIIGTHPHVIQPIEIYKEKLIFYSLGNFVFDQYFSEETQQGLALDFAFEKVGAEKIDFEVKLVPIRISEKSQPYIALSPEKEAILNALSKYSEVPSSTQEMIEKGFISAQ